MDNTEKRQRMIAMRECLQQAKQLLPKTSDHGMQFICHKILETNCDMPTIWETRAHVRRALGQGNVTFEDAMSKLNPGRVFSPTQIMTLRRKWIDMLCKRITLEIERTR